MTDIIFTMEEREFLRGVSPFDAITTDYSLKKVCETWDPAEQNVYSSTRNLAAHLQEYDWKVVLESPVKGINRTYRIPIFACREDLTLVLKVVTDPKKLNGAGLKMCEITEVLNKQSSNMLFSPAVYGTFESYDLGRATKDSFCIFLKGDLNNGVFN